MSDLLTAKDVELKIFKKVRFGGYAVAEVEDFLNQVADDLEAYANLLDEKDNRINELEAWVKKQESMTDMIKDALIQARKSAKDTEEQAAKNAEQIITDAQADAENRATEIIEQARKDAEEIILESQEKLSVSERARENIDQELESRRQEVRSESENILKNAQDEAKKILRDSESKAGVYSAQVRYLSLQKQQFIKDSMSLITEFSKIVNKAQQDIDDEMKNIEEENSLNSPDEFTNENYEKP